MTEPVELSLSADSGSASLARPKSSTFTRPSGRSMMFSGFDIAMDDAGVVCRGQRAATPMATSSTSPM